MYTHIYMLDNDKKILLTCHISCMGGVTVYVPIFSGKQDYVPTEMLHGCVDGIAGCPVTSKGKQDIGVPQQKCYVGWVGCMLDWRYVQAQRIGRRCSHRYCMGIHEKYITMEDFQPQAVREEDSWQKRD